MKKVLVCSVLLVWMVLALSTVESAVTLAGGQVCPTDDPIASVDLSTGDYLTCLDERCMVTTGAAAAAPSADGQCDSSGATEAASTASCDTILGAFSNYYACVLRAMRNDPAAPAYAKDAYTIFLQTPGAPYHISGMPCYACVNFDAVFATTALPTTCSAAGYTCEECCGQNPTTNWIGSPGKGYNMVLCGNGCMTAILMSAFTILTAMVFIMCGCCWPSPSLKTTVEEVRRQEEEEKAHAAAAMSSDDDRAREPRGGQQPQNDDEEYPTEPPQQNQRGAEDDEL